jgi:hypothetical protein
MKIKIIGIFVCALMIATCASSAMSLNHDMCIKADDERETAYSIGLSQLDLIVDGNQIPNSCVGMVILDNIPGDGYKYFNLVVNQIWALQNIPIIAEYKNQAVTFNLGVPDGEDVTYVWCAYSLDDKPRDSAPSEGTGTQVSAAYYVMFVGEKEEVFEYYHPPLEVVGTLVTSNSYYIPSDEIVNQPCGINECAPAAVSNSLNYLNNKHGLGMSASSISIATMKIATGWSTGGAPGLSDPYPWWERKKDYMEDHDYPITTEIYEAAVVDLLFLKDELKRGQDIELRVPGHVLMVVGIAKQSDGKYNIHVAHDTNQGTPGGEIVEILEYDPSLGYLTRGGVYYKDMSNCRFVVECPIEPTVPLTPYGPTVVKLGGECTLETSAEDPLGGPLEYFWWWDDNTSGEWQGPYQSGDTCKGVHKYETEGYYNVKVKARNQYGIESDWSEPLKIQVPRVRTVYHFLLVRLLEQFPNLFPLLRCILGFQ